VDEARALIRCDLVHASLLALFKKATRGCLPLVKPTESDYTRDTRTNIHLSTIPPLDRQEGPDIPPAYPEENYHFPHKWKCSTWEHTKLLYSDQIWSR